MSYLLNELKRRLEDDSMPLPKRFQLAKNVIYSHNFPTIPKERMIGEWLENLNDSNKITSNDLQNVLCWLNNVDDFTVDLKNKLIKIVALYLQHNILQDDDIQNIAAFIENSKVTAQIEDFLSITMTLLQHLVPERANVSLINNLLDNIVKYFKESKKKIEFIIKFIEVDNLETIFSFLNTDSKDKVVNVCQCILFPLNKRTLFAKYLNTLIRQDDVANLIEQTNESIESVIKIINVFINSKGNQQFLMNFITVFTCCFKLESQILFAFYIIVVNCMDISQNYIKTATTFKPILFEGHEAKVKRSIFLIMLQLLLEKEVDVNVHLRDTLNEQSKETKKHFLLFLQDVLLGTINIVKPDKTTLNIIKTALKLDPSLVDKAMVQILPAIMVSKKNINTKEIYIETINILLQTLFKLGKGINFLHDILPHLRAALEKMDDNQEHLKKKFSKPLISNDNCDKIKNKIVTGTDILPDKCTQFYGKLTSELMFRQNKDILLLLQKDLEDYLSSLEQNTCQSNITLVEMLSAILSRFLQYNKMADHTVPLQISEEYWASYQNFEKQCLKKFGKCVLKLEGGSCLQRSFLNVCIQFAELKILNIKYSNMKLEVLQIQTDEVFDLSSLLPCLKAKQWNEIASKIEDENAPLLNNLLLIKVVALHLTSNDQKNIYNTKAHLIKQVSKSSKILDSYYFRALFANLDRQQCRQLAKSLVKLYTADPEISIFQIDCIATNKDLVTAVTFETLKNIVKSFKNASVLSKSLVNDFDIESFFKDVDVEEYFNNISWNTEDNDKITISLEVLKNMQIYYLDENCQLTTIFILMALKKCCNTKKTKRAIDNILQAIFELASKTPDIYKIFSVSFLFNLENGVLKLLKTNAKMSNHFIIIQNILEFTIKQGKKDPEFNKTLVNQLRKDYNKIEIKAIEDFSDEVFQMICILLPLISKERKNSTTAVSKINLTNLQDDLNRAILESFKSVNFEKCVFYTTSTDENAISESSIAILNAMGAYAWLVAKSGESTDGNEIKSIDCLWSGLEFFLQNALHYIESPASKNHHITTAVNLLTVFLRYIKKLESHDILKEKDKLFHKIWCAIKARLFIALDHRQKRNDSFLEELNITLKFLSELSSVEVFTRNFLNDINALTVLKRPSILLESEEITSSQLISRRVLKYICINILQSYITEAKSIAFTKLIWRSIRNLRFWIQQHFGGVTQYGDKVNVIKIDDSLCELLKTDLDILSELTLSAKIIKLDYKFIDAIFELQLEIYYLLGRNSVKAKCEVSWRSFFMLFEGSVAVLNSMILSRDELLEDRWPCLMQCYKTLVLCMCERSTSNIDFDKTTEHKLAEIGLSIEKLTQCISKKKNHVSRIAAYAVADFCSALEKSPPPKVVRQHLENSIVLLIKVSDSNFAMGFLRRSLAGAIGQMTFINMYTMYKRYHKYVGNA